MSAQTRAGERSNASLSETSGGHSGFPSQTPSKSNSAAPPDSRPLHRSDARVEDALALLAGLESKPLSEQAVVLGDIHERLSKVLDGEVGP